jgi:hypothetical protein
VNLGGGPSHLDTFDLKSDAHAEFRGEFTPIATSVPGMQICEHFPKLAACTDRYTILRGADDLPSSVAIATIRPDDVPASLYRCLGIDPRKEYRTATGRPVMIVRDGRPIDGLFA